MAQIINEATSGKKILKSEEMTNHAGFGHKKTTLLTHNYIEIDGYRESFGNDNSEAVRVFDGPWDDRGRFKDAMLGYSIPVGVGISRYTPDQHPEFPWLHATDCELVQGVGAISHTSGLTAVDDDPAVIPITKSKSMICYINGAPDTGPEFADFPGKARYKVTYRSLPYDIWEDTEMPGQSEFYRYVEWRPAYAMQALPLNNFQLQFIDDNKAIGGVTKLFPTQEIQYIWYEVPEIPTNGIDECIGCINDDKFDVSIEGKYKGRDYPAETLLCLAPSIEPKRGPSGQRIFRITYRMLYRPTFQDGERKGHNYFPRVEGKKIRFQRARVSGTGDGLYLLADFNKLFMLNDAIAAAAAA